MLNKVKKIYTLIKKINTYDERFNKIELALGRIEARQNSLRSSNQLSDYEFKVSSQWGEDGIIQHLINNVAIKKKIFIEFGVENYTESNTRFLLQNNNWTGLVIDGSPEHIEYIKKDPIYWRYNLKAECAFITKDNINSLIVGSGVAIGGGEIGILSIDIDGNDYWVWEAIDCVSPCIVICEYNALFGCEHCLTVPYDEAFMRTQKHYSNLYFGASIKALVELGKKKGYEFVGTNTNSANAFFVRKDLAVGKVAQMIKTPSADDCILQARQSRDRVGTLTYLSVEEQFELIKAMKIFDLQTNSLNKLEKYGSSK